ncbi:MAG: hypothetical protein EOO16_06670 [Chitinophagaceae bacterium]|nr:MAG: hypothetical protein EOO16_06670 [Chitinophagaceae bacterium]
MGSTHEMVLHFMVTLVAISGSIAAGFHFRENPVLISILIAVALCFTWLSSYTWLILTDNSLKIVEYTLFGTKRTRAEIRFGELLLLRFVCTLNARQVRRHMRRGFYRDRRRFNAVVAVFASGNEKTYRLTIGKEQLDKLASKLPPGVRFEITVSHP